MYKVIWYKNENLVRLVSDPSPDEIVPPRIVYSDELMLLGFDKKYAFPHDEGIPICWAIERKYYYKGICIGEVKEADIYTTPKIKFTDNSITRLYPINKNKLIDINKKLMSNLENEAMDFVQSVYEKYNSKVDAFVCAFSGGKDSQINLDIVSRVINPSNYMAVFTNTGMELPCTLETVDSTRKKYFEKSSDFRLYHAKSEVNAVDQWEKIGPPSRFSRWCCSVRKSGLFTRTMKSILNIDKQPKIIVFEGVRMEESARREKYERIGVGVKHVNLINCRPIFTWNTTEIYLYSLINHVELNSAYKKGLTRVGCNICPFASNWSESMIRLLYPDLVKPYVRVVEEMARNLGIKEQSKINEYISSGNWKKNAGGRGLLIDNSSINIISRKPHLEIVIDYPKTDWKIWLNIIGNFIYSQKIIENKNIFDGDIKIDGLIYKFSVAEEEKKIKFKFYDIGNKLASVGLIIKALTKVCYCIRCGVCEAECPTGALKIRPNHFSYNKKKCIHCMNCLNVHGTGCLVASRRKVSEGGKFANMKTSGVDRYSTFGLRDEWLDVFFKRGNDYFIDYGKIGPKMKQAMRAWVREAELCDQKVLQVTETFNNISRFYFNNKKLAFEIIWINLAFNSTIVNTYVKYLDNNVRYTKKDILEQLKMLFPTLGETTLANPVDALVNMMKNCSFGYDMSTTPSVNNLKMGVISKDGKDSFITKVGSDNVSKGAICYLLYKIAETEGIYEYLVSDFYENNENLGPMKMFNLSVDKFKSILQSLSSDGLLSADLAAGLENIHLNKNLTSLEVLKRLSTNE